ncbi:hypothetical protein ACA910_004303 [Epithemia clementina (nom. ined.)]
MVNGFSMHGKSAKRISTPASCNQFAQVFETTRTTTPAPRSPTATSSTSLPRSSPRSCRLFSEPSDTSSVWDDEDFDNNNVVDVDENLLESQDEEVVMVNSLLDMLPTDTTSEVSDDVRAAINEALYRLEKLSPNNRQKPITSSPLINGVWELKYAGGPSSGATSLLPSNSLGGGGLLYVLKSSIPKLVTSRLPFFKSSGGGGGGGNGWFTPPPPPVEWLNLEVVIGRSQPRVEASVQCRIAGNDRLMGTATVVARLDTMSDVRFKETYQSIAFSAPSNSILASGGSSSSSTSSSSSSGSPMSLPEALQYSRDLYVTYVDEDLLIVRDASGAPEVLVRKSKVFSRNWGTEPSDVDDLTPPGQETD